MASKAAQAEKDRAEYLEYLSFLESNGADPQEVAKMREAATPGLGSKALDKTVRALDYLGGLARGTVAGGIEKVTGRDDLVNIEDVLRGQAPTSSEVAEKMGVPSGGSLSDVVPGMYSETGEGLPLQKGGTFDPTARGAAGFVGDVALDPLTYLSFGTAPAAKVGAKNLAQKAITPLSTAAQRVGTPLYKSGLKAADEIVAKFGKEPVSDVLMKYGASGSAQDLVSQMDVLGKKLLEERTGLLKRADEAGATASMQKAMSPTMEYVQQMRQSRDPQLQAIADAIEESASQYRSLDPDAAKSMIGLEGRPVTASEASAYKTQLYNALPDTAFAKATSVSGGKKAQKLMAEGLKTETESATRKALGEAEAQRLAELNDELGRILTSKDKQAIEARKELMKNTVTSVDAPLMLADPKLALAKKLADISKLTSTRTKGGKALKQLGESRYGGPALDVGARRSLIKYLEGDE